MPNSYGHYGILPAKFPFKDFSLDLAQQEGSRDFRIQKRGRRLYRLAGACELSHLPMCFLALFPNGIERQIWRQSLRVHNTVQNSRFARPERALESKCARNPETGRVHATDCSELRYDQTAYGGMPFVHGAGHCLSQGLDATAAALRPWDRSPTRRN